MSGQRSADDGDIGNGGSGSSSGMAGGCSMREGSDEMQRFNRFNGGSSNSNDGGGGGGTGHNDNLPYPNNLLNSYSNSSTTATTHSDGLAVFTWGRGEDGQLGLGDTADQDEPTYVSSYWIFLSQFIFSFPRPLFFDHRDCRNLPMLLLLFEYRR
jgi:Regulator of chromosome condensation (RCC1) repeat